MRLNPASQVGGTHWVRGRGLLVSRGSARQVERQDMTAAELSPRDPMSSWEEDVLASPRGLVSSKQDRADKTNLLPQPLPGKPNPRKQEQEARVRPTTPPANGARHRSTNQYDAGAPGPPTRAVSDYTQHPPDANEGASRQEMAPARPPATCPTTTTEVLQEDAPPHQHLAARIPSNEALAARLQQLEQAARRKDEELEAALQQRCACCAQALHESAARVKALEDKEAHLTAELGDARCVQAQSSHARMRAELQHEAAGAVGAALAAAETRVYIQTYRDR